jgi:hypothetical protein
MVTHRQMVIATDIFFFNFKRESRLMKYTAPSIPGICSRNNQHNAPVCTAAVFVYSYKPPYRSVFSRKSDDPEAS